VIWTTDNADAACLGAAIISGVSCGLFPNVNDAVSKMVSLKQKFEPNAENHKAYQKMFAQYKQLYADLCPLFEKTE
jgi:sugar (pentulose or hexulose) kinase